MTSRTDYWIVRCPPARTLEIKAELEQLDFAVWTPTVTREYRKARSRRFIKVVEPMLSSFLFVKAGHDAVRCAERLDDLKWLLGIRVMRSAAGYCGIKEIDLTGLRAIENEAATFGIDNLLTKDGFEIGQRGTINSAAFLGLTATLVDRQNNNLLVMLDAASAPITIKAALFCPQ